MNSEILWRMACTYIGLWHKLPVKTSSTVRQMQTAIFKKEFGKMYLMR